MATVKKEAATGKEQVTIAPPNIKTGVFTIVGIAPYVQHKFSEKAKRQMREKQEAGSTAKKGAKREARNFQDDYEAAMYRTPNGGYGIPAPAIRNAMISACRLCGFQMTRAKLSVFVEADCFDAADATPLIGIKNGEPKYFESTVRLESGVCSLAVRPKWDEGWEADVRISFDADQFTLSDVANLLARAGQQVGIGEGRPDSKNSTGLGWGLFRISNKQES